MNSAHCTSMGQTSNVQGQPGRCGETLSPAPFRVGTDLVQVSRIAESMTTFGERFMNRIFTSAEIAYANQAPAIAAERLAARFAAKEATIKALRLSGAVNWKHIEVVPTESGACDLVLHEDVARRAGACVLAVSLSHEGDFATAVVVAQWFPY